MKFEECVNDLFSEKDASFETFRATMADTKKLDDELFKTKRKETLSALGHFAHPASEFKAASFDVHAGQHAPTKRKSM